MNAVNHYLLRNFAFELTRSSNLIIIITEDDKDRWANYFLMVSSQYIMIKVCICTLVDGTQRLSNRSSILTTSPLRDIFLLMNFNDNVNKVSMSIKFVIITLLFQPDISFANKQNSMISINSREKRQYLEVKQSA